MWSFQKLTILALLTTLHGCYSPPSYASLSLTLFYVFFSDPTITSPDTLILQTQTLNPSSSIPMAPFLALFYSPAVSLLLSLLRLPASPSGWSPYLSPVSCSCVTYDTISAFPSVISLTSRNDILVPSLTPCL